MINTINNNLKQKTRTALVGNNLSSSNQEAPKPKPGIKFNPKIIFSGLLLIMLMIGGASGFYLTQTSQDVRQQASIVVDNNCKAGDMLYTTANKCSSACSPRICYSSDGPGDPWCCPKPPAPTQPPTPTPTPTNTPTPTDVSTYELNYCNDGEATGECGNARCIDYTTLVKSCRVGEPDDTTGAYQYCWQEVEVCKEGWHCSTDKCVDNTPIDPDYDDDGDNMCRVNYDTDNPNRENSGKIFAGDCVIISCPNGDTSGDGTCGHDDWGAAYEGIKECSEAVAALGDRCGQVDPVDEDGSYCETDTNGGVYALILDDEICPLPDSTPTPPTPTPTTPVGPQCLEITAFNTTGGESVPLVGNEDDNLILGTSTVRFVCAANTTLPTGYSYKFKIWEPCATDAVELDAVGGGVNYSIDLAGDYGAQCAVCDDSTGICAWETYTPTACDE